MAASWLSSRFDGVLGDRTGLWRKDESVSWRYSSLTGVKETNNSPKLERSSPIVDLPRLQPSVTSLFLRACS